MISAVYHLMSKLKRDYTSRIEFPPFGLVVFSLVFIFGTLIIPTDALRDPDTFWHIRTGQWILHNHQWPHADPFSYTYFGKPWIAKEWLSQVILAIAYDAAGWHGVIIITAFVYAAIAGVLFLYVNRFLRFSVAIGTALLTCLLLSAHFLARPHLFAYLILSLWLFSLLEAYDNGRAPPHWLAVLMLLWANIHSSFVLGLAFFYIIFAFHFFRSISSGETGTLKRTLWTLMLVTIAACTTPYGLSPLLLTWHIMGMKGMMAHLTEWQPPNFRDYPIYLAYLLTLFGLITASGIRLRSARLVLVLIAVWLGFSYTRGFIVLLITVPFIFARPAAEQVANLSRLDQGGSKRIDPVVRFFDSYRDQLSILAIGLTVLSAMLSVQLSMVEPPSVNAPKDAMKFILRTGISGRVFNSYAFGGYLIFNGIPTFIDGRADLYGDKFLSEYFAAVNLSDIRTSYHLLNLYKIDWILLKPKQALTNALRLDSIEWAEVFSDKNATVFVRAHK